MGDLTANRPAFVSNALTDSVALFRLTDATQTKRGTSIFIHYRSERS